MIKTLLLMIAAQSASAAPSAAPSAAACSAITSPAPCGQTSDSQERCESKGCCFDATKSYPCFYSTGNAVPIDTVHVVQAAHFDAGFAYTIAGVLNLHWYTHYPRALALGLALESPSNNPNGELAMKFTTQVLRVLPSFHCPPF
jgi:hypothetical protein